MARTGRPSPVDRTNTLRRAAPVADSPARPAGLPGSPGGGRVKGTGSRASPLDALSLFLFEDRHLLGDLFLQAVAGLVGGGLAHAESFGNFGGTLLLHLGPPKRLPLLGVRRTPHFVKNHQEQRFPVVVDAA